MRRSSSTAVRRCGVLLAAVTLTGCSLLFNPADYFGDFDFPWPEGTPIKTASRAEIAVLHEDPGTLAVVHGFSCAVSDRDGQEDFVRIQESLDFRDLLDADPRWITNATVFLNGFQASFEDNKHEVLGVSAAISGIEHERAELRFEGGGALADNKFTAPYEFCFTFTAFAWNRQELLLAADHGDRANTFFRLAQDNKSITSLNVLRNYRQEVDLIGDDTTVGLLPRGAGLAWIGSNQVLQASYAMGSATAVLESERVYDGAVQPQNLPDNTIRQGAGGLSWDSSFIFKPNDKVDDVFVAELVSVLGGDGMELLNPPFLIEPADEKDGCGGWFTGCIGNPEGTNGPKTVEIVVENLPYEVAIPVLNGWSLGYVVDDHTIRDLGVSIDTFSYQPPSGATLGSLRYTLTAVTDNGDNYTPALRYRVAVLGLSPEVPDEPVEPPGPVGPPPTAPPPGPATDE